MIPLLIAEDHVLVRDGMRLLVSAQPDMRLVAETGSGAQVLPLVKAHRPGVVLLDIGLPDLDGLEVLRCLEEAALDCRVLVVTARLDAATARASLALGAVGFLSKGETSDELLAAIRTVAAGGRHVGPRVVALLESDTETHPLTAREREILTLVAAGLSSREIGLRLGLTERTVRKHRENIGRKLGARNAAEMTAYALRAGLATGTTRP